jgi:hypothetical protein
VVAARIGDGGGLRFMFKVFGGRSHLVWTTAKVAVAVAFLSVLATNWLSHGGIDQGRLARLAAGARFEEPTMTGTVAKANQVKLDPCAVSRRP